MNRIDPSKIPDEFRANGVTPVRGLPCFVSGYEDSPCGCLVGEKIIAKIGFDNALRAAFSLAPVIEDFDSYHYMVGVSDGWENNRGATSNRRTYDEESPEYLAGYADGRAAWEACVAAGLCEP